MGFDDRGFDYGCFLSDKHCEEHEGDVDEDEVGVDVVDVDWDPEYQSLILLLPLLMVIQMSR